jgi:serine/threonine protein kinase/WD40 repeat protein
MDSNQYERVQGVLDRVLAAPETDRETKLKELTTGDSDLEREVRSLLAVLSDVDRDDQHPMSDHQLNEQNRRLSALIDNPEQPKPDQIERIGGYLILGVLGEGGMGVVYKALQARPARKVALKVIDVLRADDEIGKRFKAEAEIQGQLQHRGIVQIYEAGVTQIGHSNRPYIAMELIDGVSLKEFADKSELSTAGRLELLAKVADAVGYAHTKGVVHRDLKPENVLVREDGQPKVLDFGIARVTSNATLAATTMTRDGQLLGTLAFMAPEQFTGAEITPATDVYALGVIAFELIAGKPPVEIGGLSITAAMRLVDQRDSPRLRTAAPGVDRDVDTIVSKCMRLEPKLRYQNASELADDLRSLLSNKPIAARPPDTIYLTKKYIKRNRILVGGAVATMLTLAGGIVATSVVAVGQHSARVVADTNEREARRQQAALVGNEFQKASDMSASGDVFGAIEVLETIPDWLRGWGWEMLAAGQPRWMPGDQDFGGVSEVNPSSPEMNSNMHDASGVQGSHVLTIAGRKLHRWDPLTGTIEVLFPDTSFDGIERDNSPTLMRISADVSAENYATFGERHLLDLATGERELLPDNFQPGPRRNAVYNSEYHVATWTGQENNAGSDGQSHSLYFWDKANGTQLINTASAGVPCTVLHKADGKNLYVVAARGWKLRQESGSLPTHTKIFVFDSDRGEVVATTGMLDGFWMGCPMPDRNEIVFGIDIRYRDSKTNVFDLESLEFRRNLNTEGVALAYLQSLDALVVRQSNGEIILISAEDERVLQRYFPGHPMGESWPYIMPGGNLFDGKFLIATDPQHSRPVLIDTLDPESGAGPLMTARPHTEDIYNIALSPGGGLLATYHQEQNVLCIIDARTGETLWIHEPNSYKPYRGNAQLYFSRDTALVHTVGKLTENTLSQVSYDISSGSSESTSRPEIVPGFILNDPATLIPGQQLSSRASVHPDGKRLVLNRVRSVGKVIVVEDETNIQIDNQLQVTEGLAISPDGDHIALVRKGAVEIFDFVSRERVARPIVDTNRLLCASYSPDGKTLAVGTHDGRIMIIETEFYTKLFEFVASPAEILDEEYKYVYMLTWSADGKTLYSGHANGYVRSWGTLRPYEQRLIRIEQVAADERVTEMLNGFLAEGLSAKKAGDALLDDPSLSPEERAAAEVALVRGWANAEEE